MVLDTEIANKRRNQAIFRVYKNRDYSLCRTYPETILFPYNVDETTISEAGKFRTSQRLPALSYFDSQYGTSIWRSSQPARFIASRNRYDEELLRAIGQCNSNAVNAAGALMIYDARPELNAWANRGKGGGYEECGAGTNYPNCRLRFCDIENIHVVRTAYEKMMALNYQATPRLEWKTQQWLSAIESTGYLQVLQTILVAANQMLQTLSKPPFENVLVHCSDGWDRTSQMTALAQLMLDPYYRTIQGFQVLIEKEWLAFGHMFARRCGHYSSGDLTNRSPVFL